MMNFGFNNRWIRLVKDLLFVALGVWLIIRTGFIGILVGALAVAWYGRDAWFQIKALWQEKHYKPAAEPTKTARKEDSKITVTNPHGVKEVDFNKE